MWLSTHLPSPFVPADLYHLIFYKLPPSSLLSSIHLGSHVIHSDSVLASLYFLWWRLFFLITLFSVQHSTCSRADVLQSSVKSMNEWRMKPTQVLLIHLSRSSTKHFYLLFQEERTVFPTFSHFILLVVLTFSKYKFSVVLVNMATSMKPWANKGQRTHSWGVI